jgi:hypothetical protein
MKSGCGNRSTVPLWALPLLLAVLFMALVPATPAAAQVPGETGKYYIVGPPVNGQREYLYDIALRTLGNGNRFHEIVNLNRGRTEPDGATFTDGIEVAPGWILIRPVDATGQGVRTGPFPVIGPASAQPSLSPAARSPSPAAPSPSPAAPSPSPTTYSPSPAAALLSIAPVTTAAAPPALNLKLPKLSRIVPVAAPTGGGVLAVALVVFLVRRRGVFRVGSATLDDGPWPPQRHHTPTPTELAQAAAETAKLYPSVPPPASGPPPADPPGDPADPADFPEPAKPMAGDSITGEFVLAKPMATESMTAEPMTAQPMTAQPMTAQPMTAEPMTAQPMTAEPVAAEPVTEESRTAELNHLSLADLRTAEARPSHPRNRPVPGRHGEPEEELFEMVRGVGPVDGAILPRPELPAEGDMPYVRADVRSGSGPVLVRLAGVRTGPETPAYAWLADTESAPEATVPLVLGRKGPWRLHVDLGRTPDVFTLVGDPEDCRQLAAAYARQLFADGIGVAVVGDALGDEIFDDCLSLAEMPEPGDEADDPFVVITAGLPAGERDSVRDFVAATRGRCVPMLIGEVPDGRWSAQVRPED